MPSMPSVPLMSASPSLARSVSGCDAGAPATARRRPCRRPRPRRSGQGHVGQRGQVAAGPERAVLAHRRGDAGVEQGRRWCRPRPGRTPEQPIARLRARSSIIARTDLALDQRSPMPAACERISASCSSALRSGGMTVLASDPKPVETPYTGSSEAAWASTMAALRASASPASSPTVTGAPWRATLTTSAAVSPEVPMTTDSGSTSMPRSSYAPWGAGRPKLSDPGGHPAGGCRCRRRTAGRPLSRRSRPGRRAPPGRRPAARPTWPPRTPTASATSATGWTRRRGRSSASSKPPTPMPTPSTARPTAWWPTRSTR